MWTNKFFFLLAVACMAVLSTAQTLPSIPGQDPADCLSSLEVIPNCISEIFGSIISGHIGTVGHSCCHAFLVLNADCITQTFAFAPLFPPSLRDHCSKQSLP
ncbi:hypothetical protein Rs2_07120 [Raphanus sativus]|nr:uncharacterized protein LOC130499706 [Raphanus sativus]KAJ4888060.1 hypothetical protein Rs2_27808 [Raphanus sativus]KAJ4912499.1 hypothetical protein Rs2_07120 [Raphanus sativus]